jgi:hypothetical protein
VASQAVFTSSHHEYDGLNRRASKRRINRVEAEDGDKKAPISSQETGECGVRWLGAVFETTVSTSRSGNRQEDFGGIHVVV